MFKFIFRLYYPWSSQYCVQIVKVWYTYHPHHIDIDNDSIVYQIDARNLIKKEPNNFAGLFWVEFQMKFLSVFEKS
jgi:hypothetical protein